jgi:hypothetical protein
MLCTLLALLTAKMTKKADGTEARADDSGGSSGAYNLHVAMPDGRQIEYPVSKTCACTRDGKDCQLTALQPTDRLELFGQPVTRITATEDRVAMAARKGFGGKYPSEARK